MGCCVTLAGFTRGCDSNIGGIRRVWLACYDNVTRGEATDGIISSVTPPSAFYEYEFRKQTGSVTTTINRDDAVGSLYYENVITLQFSKQEAKKRNEIKAIAQSDLVVIIEDNNGKYWYFGYDFPVTLSDGSAETGTSFSDLNGYTITLTDMSKELPYEVSQSVIDSIIGV